jgi:hypothetical protein
VNNDPYGNFLNCGGYSEKDTLMNSSVQYRIDAQRGYSWKYTNVVLHYDYGTFDTTRSEMTCIATDTLVIVPKGEFKCKVYEHTPNSGADIFKIYFPKHRHHTNRAI